MKVHLPALVALVSAATYVACGSSDASKTAQAGGAAGEGGQAPSAGGSKNTAGSLSSGGSLNNAGAAGEPVEATPAGAGPVGGEANGGVGGLLAAAGAGGEGGASNATVLPPECPGVVGDYTVTDGTADADVFNLSQTGEALVFGLDGDDVFNAGLTGQACLVGGDGDDDFTTGGEASGYFIGGTGADVYHLVGAGAAYIGDMQPDDTIGLSITEFDFLFGSAGATPDAQQLVSVAGYSTGNGTVPTSEFSGAIVYDPDNGTLWADTDRGDNTTGARRIGTILNFSTYTFDVGDFELE